MHNSIRSSQRREKLLNRGWLEKNTADVKRRSKLEFLIPEEKIEFIKEYENETLKRSFSFVEIIYT